MLRLFKHAFRRQNYCRYLASRRQFQTAQKFAHEIFNRDNNFLIDNFQTSPGWHIYRKNLENLEISHEKLDFPEEKILFFLPVYDSQHNLVSASFLGQEGYYFWNNSSLDENSSSDFCDLPATETLITDKNTNLIGIKNFWRKQVVTLREINASLTNTNFDIASDFLKFQNIWHKNPWFETFPQESNSRLVEIIREAQDFSPSAEKCAAEHAAELLINLENSSKISENFNDQMLNQMMLIHSLQTCFYWTVDNFVKFAGHDINLQAEILRNSKSFEILENDTILVKENFKDSKTGYFMQFENDARSANSAGLKFEDFDSLKYEFQTAKSEILDLLEAKKRQNSNSPPQSILNRRPPTEFNFIDIPYKNYGKLVDFKKFHESSSLVEFCNVFLVKLDEKLENQTYAINKIDEKGWEIKLQLPKNFEVDLEAIEKESLEFLSAQI